MVQLQLVILFSWQYSLNCNPNSILKKDGIKLQRIKAKKEFILIFAADCFGVTLAAQKRQGAGGKRMATLHHYTVGQSCMQLCLIAKILKLGFKKIKSPQPEV